MLCGQKALCSLISLAGLTTLVTLGETTVLGAGWGHGDRTGQKKKTKTQPTSNSKKGSRMVWCIWQWAKAQVKTKPGTGKRIRIWPSRKLRQRKEGPMCWMTASETARPTAAAELLSHLAFDSPQAETPNAILPSGSQSPFCTPTYFSPLRGHSPTDEYEIEQIDGVDSLGQRLLHLCTEFRHACSEPHPACAHLIYRSGIDPWSSTCLEKLRHAVDSLQIWSTHGAVNLVTQLRLDTSATCARLKKSRDAVDGSGCPTVQT